MAADLRARLDFAVDAAYQAGRIALRYFQTGVEAERKADDTPVTIADREAETRIRSLIGRAYPQDGIAGEEFEDTGGSSGRRWIIDPIDGTKSFVHGVPLFGVLIALEGPADVEVGVVHLPALGETVWAARGEGCWWNGRRAQVSTTADLAAACVCFTSWTAFADHGKLPAWERVSQRAGLVRGWGDCYGHILVATGRADAMFDAAMKPWDCGPLLPILEEAGGTFTDWQGRRGIHGADAFSTNGALYPAVQQALGDQAP